MNFWNVNLFVTCMVSVLVLILSCCQISQLRHITITTSKIKFDLKSNRTTPPASISVPLKTSYYSETEIDMPTKKNKRINY